MRAPVLVPLAAALALAGCSPASDAPDPGAVTASEAKALDEAAEMLEERRLPADAATTPEATPDAAPAPAR